MFKMILRILLKRLVPDSVIVVTGLLMGVPITFPTETGYKTIRILSGKGRYCEPWMTTSKSAPKSGAVPSSPAFLTIYSEEYPTFFNQSSKNFPLG